MCYKTILVHADLSRHAPERLRLAARLAREHGAHLCGVAATGVSRDVFPHGYHSVPGSLEASYFDPLRDAAKRALAQFSAIAGEEGVPSSTRLACDLASDALARQARFGDLVVLSQDDPAEALTDTIGRIPEYVVFASARPVLVTPRVPAAGQAGRQVLVAWNGSKEASAALRAALPLLRRAGRVRVVSFCTEDGAGAPDADEQADIGAFLARHTVRAEVSTVGGGIGNGHALLDLAAREGDDLIVMGCYGHTQFHELFLGGVSRTVLQDSTVPVLMAR